MSVVIVIPARYQSSRYPGKPLALLKGATGLAKPLIQRSWEAAVAVPGVDAVYIATDSEEIAKAAAGFGGAVLMTPEECRNGTERCAACLDQLSPEPEIVVNLQGDAPLTPPWFLTALIEGLRADPTVSVATPVLRCDAQTHRHFVEDRQAGRVGGTTAVFDRQGRALYFSKEVIPFTGRTFEPSDQVPVFHHVGVYAYRPQALRDYAAAEMGRLERWEGLEQLRFLELGLPLACVDVAAKGRQFWELNNPVDVARIEAILAAEGIA